jgi:serine/threonine protein kinase
MLAPSHTFALDWSESPSSNIDAAPRTNHEQSEGNAIPQLCRTFAERVLGNDPEYRSFAQKSKAPPEGQADYLCVSADQAHTTAELFDRLRWGGVCLFTSPHRKQVVEAVDQFKQHGFAIERGPTHVRDGWRIPLLSKSIHGVVARKVELLPQGHSTNRFTYDVHLATHSDPNEPIVVEKQIPTLEAVIERLKKKHPEYPAAGIEKLAGKFVNRIFPTFLTREAGMLKILQEHVPAPYNKRVPRLISMEKDERGFVRQLKMSWLRNGGEPLPQMEFARQSADLLRVLHDAARVVHLDLRLDNFVITPDGVGFVDFGSAVRDGEDLSRNPLLQSLFGELMRTSQIQRLMEKMTLSGQVTSQAICNGSGRPDKAADFFYLALQFNAPLSNPDLAGLIQYDPGSRDASQLSSLTSQILRPRDPAQPLFRSAKDILHGIERIQRGLSWQV